ncbi:hypothetical protein AVEN_107059-1 [Araneus ventricosus]|uniref:Uncharacterized protein n=1 Tax=Araneus ventricosus TaxID=182803 RepID=A0A4Y2JQH0_ARAVE|nr:hypothetical protein AVEN_107059-1 [Araneus ventricosus]
MIFRQNKVVSIFAMRLGSFILTRKLSYPRPCLGSSSMKNNRCDTSDTEVGVLSAISCPSRRRYVSSSVEGESTPPFLYLEKGKPAYLFCGFSSTYSCHRPRGSLTL